MSAYTKGPWYAELGEVHQVRDAEGGRICILTQLRGRHGLGGRRTDGESTANARLIAAAPDLVEALKGCIVDLKVVQDEICEISPSLSVAKAAIAKAEGK